VESSTVETAGTIAGDSAASRTAFGLLGTNVGFAGSRCDPIRTGLGEPLLEVDVL